MRNHKNQRNRFRSGYRSNRKSGINGSSSHISGFTSNKNGNFRQNQNPNRMIEKYTSLAKEALSGGDKILSENYFQHADHFLRIIESRNNIVEPKKESNETIEPREESIDTEKIKNTENQ